MKTMRYILPLLIIALCVTMMGCDKSSQNTGKSADSLTVKTVTLADTTSFTKRDGQSCLITSSARFEVPENTADTAKLKHLLALYAKHILHAPDSIDFNDALRACVANSMHQFDNIAEPSEVIEEEEDNSDPVLRYVTSTAVTLMYNTNGVATFCRVDTIRKNDITTWVAHRYYNFDLNTLERLTAHELIADEHIGELTQLLRTQLLKQNNATSDAQLNTLGYFNVDNITPTANFYPTPEGITWSFLPGELAIDAVGEPTISLTFEQLARLDGLTPIIKQLQ